MKVLAEKIGRYDTEGPSNNSSYNAKKTPNGYGDWLMGQVQEVATLDFSSERKTMSKIVTGYAGKQNNVVLLKGAPERVLDKCTKIMMENGQERQMNENQRNTLKEKIRTIGGQGFRMMAVAIGLDGGNMKQVTVDNAKQQLADSSQY